MSLLVKYWVMDYRLFKQEPNDTEPWPSAFQAVYKAEDVSRVFAELKVVVEEAHSLAMFLQRYHYDDYAGLPYGAVETFDEAQRLLAGLDKQKKTEAPGIEWSEDMPSGY